LQFILLQEIEKETSYYPSSNQPVPSRIGTIPPGQRETQKKERQEYWRYLEDLIDANDPASEQPSKQKEF
jgi:hypothetical protein